MRKTVIAIALTAIMVLAVATGSLAEGTSVRIVLGAKETQGMQDGTVRITDGGTYSIAGALKEGCIEIDTDEAVVLELDNVSITSSAGPAIISNGTGDVAVVAKAWTTSYLRNSLYGKADSSAIQVEGNLELKGEGSIYISSVSSDGIRCGGELAFSCSMARISAFGTELPL